MLRISVCVCAFFLLACCVLSMAAQPTAASASEIVPPATTLYGCVNNSTGAIRIVQSFTTCKSTEHKVHWNQVGPQGPQGPQGARGPQGPQGPQGISVGYSALTGIAADIPISSTFALVAQTNSVGTSGTYYVSMSAM